MDRGARPERGDRPERSGTGRSRGGRGRGRDRDREGGEEREPRSRGGRGRGRGRDLAESLPPSEPRLSGDEATGTPVLPAPTFDEEPAMQPAASTAAPSEAVRSMPAEAPLNSQATTPAPAKTTAEVPAGLGRGRRGPRGRGTPAAPPPLLPGQTFDLGGSTASVPSTSAPQPSPEVHDVAPMDEQVAASAGTDAEPRAAKPIGPIPSLRGVLDPKQLGLPTEAGAVTRYLTNRYRGVGDKTAEQLVETFGAENVFAALQAAPDRVTELVGAHRAGALLDAWRVDFARRSGDESQPGPQVTRAAARPTREYDDADGEDDHASYSSEPQPVESAHEEEAPESTKSFEPTDSFEPQAEPEAETDVEPAAAAGGVERELPAETPERETADETSDREVLASDVEREGTPDLWTTSRDPRVE